jgi:hypothetical protein
MTGRAKDKTDKIESVYLGQDLLQYCFKVSGKENGTPCVKLGKTALVFLMWLHL